MHSTTKIQHLMIISNFINSDIIRFIIGVTLISLQCIIPERRNKMHSTTKIQHLMIISNFINSDIIRFIIGVTLISLRKKQ